MTVLVKCSDRYHPPSPHELIAVGLLRRSGHLATTIASTASTIALNNKTRMKLGDTKYYKFFMLLFNILNIAIGVLVIGCCIIYMREMKYKPEQQSAISRGVLAFFITLSLFMIVTAVLGCVGALKLHVKTLYVELCFYIFLISIEILVGVGALLINAWVGGTDDLRVHFYKNTTLEEDAARHYSWDRLQAEMMCCGVDGPHDYSVIHKEIPPSCCATAHALREGGAKRQLHTACLNEKTYYVKGCEQAIKSKKTKNERVTALFGCILILLELTVVLLTYSMIRRIRRQRRQLQQNLQAHFES